MHATVTGLEHLTVDAGAADYGHFHPAPPYAQESLESLFAPAQTPTSVAEFLVYHHHTPSPPPPPPPAFMLLSTPPHATAAMFPHAPEPKLPPKRRKRRAPMSEASDNGRRAKMTRATRSAPKVSSCSGSSNSEHEDSDHAQDPPTTPGEQKKEIRKMKNRASAAKSRLKAQARVEQLELDVVELYRQNTYLRGLLAMYSGAVGATSSSAGSTPTGAEGSMGLAMGLQLPPAPPSPLAHVAVSF